MAEAGSPNSPNPVKRKRSVSLTEAACQNLKDHVAKEGRTRHPSKRLTREARAEIFGVSIVTAEKILRRECVDRATLMIAFNSVGLNLEESDIQEPSQGEEVSQDDPNRTLTSDKMASGSQSSIRFSQPLQKGLIVVGLVAVAAIGVSYYTGMPKGWDPYPVHKKAADAYHTGDLQASGRYVEELLEKSKNEDSLGGFTVALRNSADVAYGKGNYQEALETFQECRKTWVKLKSIEHIAELDEAIGNVHLRLDELDQAKASFESCLRGQVGVGNEVGMAEAHRGLGSVAYKKGDLKEAKSRFEAALRLLSSYDKEPMKVDIKGRMAKVKAKDGDVDQALIDLKECLLFWEKSQSKRWCALLEMEIGELSMQQGDQQGSAKYLKSSENTFRKIGDMGNLARVQEIAAKIKPKSKM